MNVSMGVAVKQESGVFPVVWSAPPPGLAPSMTYRSVLFVFTCTHWKHVQAIQILKWCRRLSSKENIFLETEASNIGEIKGAQMPTLAHYYQVLFKQCQRCCYLETVLSSK